MAEHSLPEKTRIRIFTRLVEVQDEADFLDKEEVVLTRRDVARKFQITLTVLQAIEDEGLRRGWLEKYVDGIPPPPKTAADRRVVDRRRT